MKDIFVACIDGLTGFPDAIHAAYPNAESAFKIMYLAIQEASKKWTMPIPQWKAALNHFAILFEGRVPQ